MASPPAHPCRVLVFGEALLDEMGGERLPGGAPFNVACHLQGLGLSPLLLTRVGNDADGSLLLGEMESRGLSILGVQVDLERPTGRVAVAATHSGPQFVIPPCQAYDAIDGAAAVRVAKAQEPALVYFGTLAQREPSSRAALAGVLRATRARRFVDVNLRPPWYDLPVVASSLRGASVAKLNAEELAVVLSLTGLDVDPAVATGDEALARVLGVRTLLVTSGEAGARLVSVTARSTRTVSIAGEPLGASLVDSVGAGDAFTAAAIDSLLRRLPERELLSRADALARAVCGIRGAVPRDSSFYEPFRRPDGSRT